MTEADRQREVMKEELGRLVWDAVEEYFPEEAESRRRSTQWRTLALGIAIGLFFRQAAKWWMRSQ